MAWNPDIYNKFKSDRSAPFHDLLALISQRPQMSVIDLGCGTGELTGELSILLRDALILGIDSSPEMLSQAMSFAGERLRFEQRAIEEQVTLPAKWDLVFSNAAIQWVDDHVQLLPAIISIINTGGQLLMQLPSQYQNLSNRLLDELADEEPFSGVLSKWQRISPVLSIDDYARLLFANGAKSMNVYEKVYPVVLKDAAALFDWVSGTALIPYLEKLPAADQEKFKIAYLQRLEKSFPGSPIFYPFKRIIIEAKFP